MLLIKDAHAAHLVCGSKHTVRLLLVGMHGLAHSVHCVVQGHHSRSLHLANAPPCSSDDCNLALQQFAACHDLVRCEASCYQEQPCNLLGLD